jgi:hypothetical protein
MGTILFKLWSESNVVVDADGFQRSKEQGACRSRADGSARSHRGFMRRSPECRPPTAAARADIVVARQKYSGKNVCPADAEAPRVMAATAAFAVATNTFVRSS